MDMFDELRENERERAIVFTALNCIRTGNSQMFRGKEMKAKTLLKKAIDLGSLNVDIGLLIADKYYKNDMLSGLRYTKAAEAIFKEAQDVFNSFDIRPLNTHKYKDDEIAGVAIYYKYPHYLNTAYAVYIGEYELKMMEDDS